MPLALLVWPSMAATVRDEAALAAMEARPDVGIEQNADYRHWKADEQEFQRKNLTWTSIGRESGAGSRPPSRFAFFAGGFLGGFLGVLAFKSATGHGRVNADAFGSALVAGGAMGLVGIGFSFRIAPYNPRASLDAPADAPLDRSPLLRDWSRIAREPDAPLSPPGY